MDPIAHTVNDLGVVLRRTLDCRRSLAAPEADGALAPDALALLDDLEEHAYDLVRRVRRVARGPWGEPTAAATLH